MTPIRITVLVVNNRTGQIETVFDSNPSFNQRLQRLLTSQGIYDTHPDSLVITSDAEHRPQMERRKHLNVYFCALSYTQSEENKDKSIFERLERTILVSQIRISL